jgi:hypothetical protein
MPAQHNTATFAAEVLSDVKLSGWLRQETPSDITYRRLRWRSTRRQVGYSPSGR